MIDNRLIYVMSLLLFLVGLYGVLTRKNILKMLVAVSIMETAANIFLIGLGYISNSSAPILSESLKQVNLLGSNISDPLPHSLVLTAIVIGVGTTALGIAIAVRLYSHYRTLNINKMGDKDEL
ncbi:MAG: cation:proton antiporter subunit C [bacterium]|nr:cation:proton antiporter subunit C [bacterium]